MLVFPELEAPLRKMIVPVMAKKAGAQAPADGRMLDAIPSLWPISWPATSSLILLFLQRQALLVLLSS